MKKQLPQGYRLRYNVVFPPNSDGTPLNDLEIEYVLFERSGTSKTSKYDHCKNIISILWPRLQVHRWLERELRAFCKNNFTGLSGCASSGKSFGMAIWALIRWWQDPINTLVFVVSTTKKAARQRVWAHVQKLFRTVAIPMPGKLLGSVDSIVLREMSNAEMGTDASAIILVAGGESDALDNLQGAKNDQVILIVDEAQDVNNLVEDALWNLKNNDNFEFRCAGNPSVTHDFHGRFCEPIIPGGHANDLEDLFEWEILALGMYAGSVVHFNSADSPNFELEAAGKPLLTYLPKPEDVRVTRATLGRDDPRLWRQSIGCWPQTSGVRQTVFSDAEVAKFKIKERVELSSSKRGFGIDPSYTEGGDNFVVRPFDLGLDAESKSKLQFEKPILIPDAPYYEEDGTMYRGNFARAKRVRDLALEHGVLPRHIGIDSTGANPFPDILDAELDVTPGSSDGVLRIEFGANASEDAVSLFDDRESKEAYQDKGTELYFSLREFAEHDQLRGISDDKTIKQLTGRKFLVRARGKLKLERKTDYKKRTGQSSPDEADATACGGEVARQRMSAVAGMATIEVRQELFRADAQKALSLRHAGLRSVGGVGALRSTGGAMRLK